MRVFLRQTFANTVLEHCARCVPNPEILLQRYDEVVKLYRDTRGSTTGERMRLEN